MRLLRILIFGLCFLLVSGSMAQAQGSDGDSSRESRRNRVHQLIVTRLANGLGLDQKQAEQLGEVLRKYRRNKRQYRREVRALTAQLRQETANKNEKAIKETLKKLSHARDQLDRSDEVMFREVKTMLNPNQVAQFVLIMDEIRHEVRAVRRQGRRRYRPGGSQPYQWNQPPGGQNPTTQPGLTNQTGNPGYWRGYGPAPKNGVWVGN